MHGKRHSRVAASLHSRSRACRPHLHWAQPKKAYGWHKSQGKRPAMASEDKAARLSQWTHLLNVFAARTPKRKQAVATSVPRFIIMTAVLTQSESKISYHQSASSFGTVCASPFPSKIRHKNRRKRQLLRSFHALFSKHFVDAGS
jgi:hypothetical protein